MKLTNRVLYYIVNNNEAIGIWSEKILCDIIGIPFNTTRCYTNPDASNGSTEYTYPSKLKKDISNTFRESFINIGISEHIGNRNNSIDFLTGTNKTVSLKTNISGFKVCPANIGQTTSKKLKDYFGAEFTKEYIIQNINVVLQEYIKNCFTNDHLMCIKYDTGKIYHFLKGSDVILDKNINYQFTNNLENWNESNTVKTTIDNKDYPVAEFQIHNNRNCIKCRLNFNTIILMIKSSKLTGLSLTEHTLKYKYVIKVKKEIVT